MVSGVKLTLASFAGQGGAHKAARHREWKAFADPIAPPVQPVLTSQTVAL